MAGKGEPKSGGRKKGTPNKRTRELIEILDQHGFCPASALIETHTIAMKEYHRAGEIFDAIQDKRADYDMIPLAADEATKYLKIAQDAAKEMMAYVYPKRKPIDSAPVNDDDANQKIEAKWVIKQGEAEKPTAPTEIAKELDGEYDR